MSTSSEAGKAGRSAESPRLEFSLGAAALSAYAGAAVVLDRNGVVVAANGRAEVLCQAIAEDRLPPLNTLLSAGRPVVETLPVLAGGAVMLELSALPAEGGLVLVLGRDVTLERNLRSALVESRQRYKDLVEISSDFAWEVGGDGRFVFVSPKGALGFAADELVGREPAEFIAPVGADAASPFTATLPVEDAEVWMKLADGTEACVLLSSTPVLGENGEWRGARGVCRDVTQERLRDAALSRANNRERLLSYIVRTIRDEVEPGDMLRAAAEATARALGATGCQIFRIIPDASDFALAAQYGDSADEKTVLDSFIASDHFDQDLDGWHVLASVSRYRHSINGAVLLWREGARAAWSDDDRLLIDDVANQVGLANEQIANHERILRLSRTDSLTGLFNRRAFFEEIARRFNRLSREHRPAALIYVDLDNFKLVNDVHGHHAGDQALLKVRDLLLQHTRPTDIVARLGGDEFAILAFDVDEEGAAVIADSYNRQLADYTFQAKGRSVDIGCSIGVALLGPELEGGVDVLARADLACHIAKQQGRNRYHFYQPEDEQSTARLTAEIGYGKLLRDALANDHLALNFQPIVELPGGQVRLHEVLVRLRNRDGSYLAAGAFVTEAERLGLATDIDIWVVRNAFAAIAKGQVPAGPGRFSINLSGRSIGDARLTAAITEALHEHAIIPANIVFEFTETAAFTSLAHAKDFIAWLRGHGFQTALDDFGAGYSSFVYLRELSTDYVKLDGSLVRSIDSDPLNLAVVRAMSDVARVLGRRLIAEFVENAAIAAHLHDVGIDLAQGYHFGRPEPWRRPAPAPERAGAALPLMTAPSLA